MAMLAMGSSIVAIVSAAWLVRRINAIRKARMVGAIDLDAAVATYLMVFGIVFAVLFAILAAGAR